MIAERQSTSPGTDDTSRRIRYVDETRCRVSELESLCCAGHTDELADAALQMAGTASEFGFQELTQLAEDLRSACESEDLEEADRAVESIRSIVARMQP